MLQDIAMLLFLVTSDWKIDVFDIDRDANQISFYLQIDIDDYVPQALYNNMKVKFCNIQGGYLNRKCVD